MTTSAERLIRPRCRAYAGSLRNLSLSAAPLALYQAKAASLEPPGLALFAVPGSWVIELRAYHVATPWSLVGRPSQTNWLLVLWRGYMATNPPPRGSSMPSGQRKTLSPRRGAPEACT